MLGRCGVAMGKKHILNGLDQVLDSPLIPQPFSPA